MRMSCNGCRVLRKGCSEDCTIRPCLDWIKNPEAQGNATVFLAKFYGRAGLLNLIAAGPDHLRPAIFRSLLYEACGRMVNPIYGSVGLLWSGNWPLCQVAVDAVLNGTPIVQLQSNGSSEIPAPPLKSFDIRHVAKTNDHNPHLLKTNRTRFKRVKNEKSVQSFNQSELNYKSYKEQLSNGHEDGSVVSGDTVTAPVGGAFELDLTLTLGSNQELSA